jgi:hypothetical protein
MSYNGSGDHTSGVIYLPETMFDSSGGGTIAAVRVIADSCQHTGGYSLTIDTGNFAALGKALVESHPPSLSHLRGREADDPFGGFACWSPSLSSAGSKAIIGSSDPHFASSTQTNPHTWPGGRLGQSSPRSGRAAGAERQK